jgi:hypothetical protein
MNKAQCVRETLMGHHRPEVLATKSGRRGAPENTIIVSPDDKSRQQINEAVRGEMWHKGILGEDGREFQTLSQRWI